MDKERHGKKPDDRTIVLPPGDGQDCLLIRKSKLLVVSGPLQGEEFMVNNDVFTIGSGPHNDLILEDSTISRRHCEIRLTPEGYVARDLGSTNGMIVQGVKVTEAFLGHGAELQLGKTKTVFCPLQEAREYALSRNESFGALIGRSFPMRRVFHLAEMYAPTEAAIFIEGETGTGKEVLAEEIHRHSKRRDKLFSIIDCAALAKDLIESELFGHIKGAFTGANMDRVGVFEHARGGTVLLDEIGELRPELQPKLLRVLEKKEIRRVGSNDIRNIDVRIISATNKKLENEVNAGRFREDLCFRLLVVRIEMPPLRKRKEDIPLLTSHFLKLLHGEDALKEVADFDRAMEAFKRYNWPGNVRELRNLVEIAFYSGRRPVDLETFLPHGAFRTTESGAGREFAFDRPFKEAKGELITEFESEYIRNLLKRNKGNVSRAAREAGIERAYLQRLIRKYDLK